MREFRHRYVLQGMLWPGGLSQASPHVGAEAVDVEEYGSIGLAPY